MFPDRASLYVLAIEDRQFKDFKIHCECGVSVFMNPRFDPLHFPRPTPTVTQVDPNASASDRCGHAHAAAYSSSATAVVPGWGAGERGRG